MTLLLLAALAAGSVAQASAAAEADPCPGLRIASVRAESTAEANGLRAGDVLRAWRFEDSQSARGIDPQGPICSFFDHYRLTLEIRPRGAIELGRQRGDDDIVFVPGSLSGAKLQVAFEQEMTALWETAEPLRNESSPAADEAWGRLIEASEERAPIPVRAWILVERGFGLARNGQPGAGDRLLLQAHALAQPGHPWIAAHIQRTRGTVFGDRDLASIPPLEAARDAWAEQGEELSAAHATELLGLGALVRFELEGAEKLLSAVESTRDRLAPDSAFLAQVNSNLGVLHFRLGNRREAVHRTLKARRILAKHPPGRTFVSTYTNAAGFYGALGETDRQIEDAEEALRLVRELGYGGSSEFSALFSLAQATLARGDLARAEALAREAIVAAEPLRDKSYLAAAHQQIGWLAELRGDLEEAEQAYRRTVEVEAEISTSSPDLAAASASLAQVLALRGRLDEASRTFRQAARHLAKNAPTHFSIMSVRGQWAELLLTQERPLDALEQAELAVAKGLELEAGGGHMLIARLARGQALLALGRPDQAFEEAETALALSRRFAPRTVSEAQALGLLGRVEARRGRTREAAEAYCSGVELLENQIERLGGLADSEARFRSRHLLLFEGCAEARLALGDSAQAFHVIERSRAWRTRRALAERGLLVGSRVGGGLAPRFRRLAAEHDEVLEQLAAAQDDAEASDRLRSRLRELGLERETLWTEARAADPRLTTLTYPTPLTARQAAGHLRPGELLVQFEVMDEATLALALDPSGRVRGYRLPLGDRELRRLVDALLTAIAERDSAADPQSSAADLWATIVAPVLGDRQLASRLIVLADGPLLRLPWAALGRRDGDDRWRWLVEDLAVTVAPSATVLAELLERPATRADRVAAFGDPAFAAGTAAAPDGLRSLLELRGTLQPLPGSRAEVTALSEIFARRPLDVYLGPEASETNARGLGPDQRIVHFASHALVDEVHPLESGLVLATPESPQAGLDNGFLQAWEIVDGLRLDADLVTLSACSTARGAELRGEGTLDLASAFLHAGARSVVASLWPVSDRSTATLMEVFYRELAGGVARDEALRRAQVSLLRGGSEGEDGAERGVGGLAPSPGAAPPERKATPPFYWAAFRLVGDPG